MFRAFSVFGPCCVSSFSNDMAPIIFSNLKDLVLAIQIGRLELVLENPHDLFLWQTGKTEDNIFDFWEDRA